MAKSGNIAHDPVNERNCDFSPTTLVIITKRRKCAGRVLVKGKWVTPTPVRAANAKTRIGTGHGSEGYKMASLKAAKPKIINTLDSVITLLQSDESVKETEWQAVMIAREVLASCSTLQLANAVEKTSAKLKLRSN